MTPKEYLQKLGEIRQAQHEHTRTLEHMLKADYLKDNCPYKVGDTFTDHLGTMRIDRILPWPGNRSEVPGAQFHGPVVLKKGKLGKMRFGYWNSESKKAE